MKTLPAHAILYTPDENTEIVGAIQIVHGMAEHQLRYKDFAQFLASNGYVVITSDLRGHGDNINRVADLGYFGDNAVANLVSDVNEISIYIRDQYAGLPYFLFGHSMGTMICTCYFKRYSAFLDGMFLSGMPGKNSAAGVGLIATDIVSFIHGDYYRSKLLDNLLNGPFRKPFRSEKCPVSWIASDPLVWETYENDPKCGFVFTVNGFRTVLELMRFSTTDAGKWNKRKMDIPIRFISGAQDPCMGGEHKMKNAVKMFKNEGYKDCTYKLYPGMRHEILNDRLKNTVYDYVLTEMNRIGAEKKKH